MPVDTLSRLRDNLYELKICNQQLLKIRINYGTPYLYQ